MPLIAHTVSLHGINEKHKSKMKQICQDWTRLDDKTYVMHHSEALKNACPLCQMENNK